MHRCGRSLFLAKRRTNLFRFHSSTPTLAATEPTSSTSLPKPNALTLIHKASALLPRVFSPAPKHPVESLKLWTDLLDYAHDASIVRKDSTSGESRKARIVVHGVHPDSGAFDLVTALLEDEFSNPETTSLLHSRPRNITRSIQSGSAPTQSPDSLSLRSQWLTRFPTPVEIVELPSATSDAELMTLLTADIPVVVFNPIMTPPTSVLQSPLYRAVLDHPHAMLVVIGIETPETRAHIQSLFASSSRSDHSSGQAEEGAWTIWTKPPKVIYVNPSQALESLSTLKKNPGSLQAIEVYQHGKLSSRISDFDSAVRETLTEAKATLGNDASPPAFTAVALLNRSLNLARHSLNNSLREVDDLTCDIGELLGEAEKTKVCLHPEVLGIWDSIRGKEAETDEVKKAMVKSREDVERALNRLGWWKLLWRVDDVQEVVNAAIRQQWCRDLERTLIFHTGRLQAIQTHLKDKTVRLLHLFRPASPFSSVIRNNCQQLISSPTYPLPPAALLQPLSDRRDMLANHPVVRLHLAAQRVVFSTLGSATTSLGVLWANWVGLIENINLLGLSIGGETIVGTGILAGVVGLRWSVARWEKAKRGFWADWERVGNGLARDLTATLDEKFDRHVASVPMAACEQLGSLGKKRREELAELEGQVDTLLRDSKNLYSG
ncbi:hypothetical protein BJ322DRAFT_1007209 [Thelephora terrestris]|uniref:Mmc1 C-terminal domain-containing protein n=1 Tax=Thelephora terrestris TaxID=56493 RepID=A0A9P6HFM8_9AGAM|nr:hypothetical protein BJ322DRAFT_1007209 [Thelephora terrestris]